MSEQELIEIKVLFDQAKQAFDQIDDKLDSFGKKVENVSKMLDDSEQKAKKNANAFQLAGSALTEIGKGLDSLGNKLLYFGASWSAGVSVPLQQFGTDAVKIFINVDKEWTRMSKSVGGSTNDLKDIYGDFAQMLSEKFGQAQSTVVESFTAISLAGFNTEKQIRTLGEVAAIAAVNFDTDLPNATKIVIQMMSQWGWTLDNVRAGLSMVNEVADATATSELDLATAFTIAGPTAKAMGVEAENLAGMLAAVERKGFTASKAGYALNTLFQRLTNQTGDLKDALKVMGVNMSTNELKTKTATEKVQLLANAYLNFRNKTQLSTEVMQNFAKQAESTDGNIKSNNKNMQAMADAISTLAGKQHFPKLLALLDDMANGMDNNSNTISDYTRALQVAGVGNDTLLDKLESKTDVALSSASAKWSQLTEKVNNAKVQIGGLILQAITPLVDKFGMLLDKFNALDDIQKQSIVKWGLIAAAIGPLMIVVASLVKGLALVSSSLGTIFTMIGNAGAVVGGGPFVIIGALIAGIVYWLAKFKDAFENNFIKNLQPSVFTGIAKAWDSLVKGIQKGFGMINEKGAEDSFLTIIGNGLKDLAERINKVDWGKVAEFAGMIGQAIGVFAKVVVILVKIVSALILVSLWVTSLMGIIGDFIRNALVAFVQWGGNVINSIVTWTQGALAAVAKWGTDTWNAITTWVGNAVGAVVQWGTDTINAIVGFAAGIFKAVTTVFSPVIELVQAILGFAFAWIKLEFLVLALAIKTVFDGIVVIFSTAWNAIVAVMTPIIEGIVWLVITSFNLVKDTLVIIWTAISGAVATAWAWIRDNVFVPIASALMKYVVNPFNDMKDKAIEKVSKLWSGVTEWFDKIKQGVNDKATNIKDSVVKIFDDIGKFIGGWVGKAWTWGSDMIMNFINGIKDKLHKLTETINGMADEIKKRLGFSVPDIGPLSQADTWMPDFVDLMATSLNKSMPQLIATVSMAAKQIQGAINPQTLFAGAGLAGQTLALTPTADIAGFTRGIQSRLAVPISAASPSQNIVQVHKHFEYKPGVSIASPSEMREFIRQTAKMAEVEDIRNSSSNVNT